MITIRQATLADKDAIFDFIKLAYPGRWQYKIPERWEWEFVKNPYWGKENLPIWIALENGGRVVGQAAVMQEPLKLGDQEALVSWGVDAYVLPDFRGQGIGTSLQEAQYAAHPIFMSINMSAGIIGIKKKLGSKPIERVRTYIKTLSHDAASVRRRLTGSPDPSGPLGRILHGTRLDNAVARGLNTRMRRRDAQWQTQADPQVQVLEADGFSATFDSLWEQVSPEYYALVRRDQAYLTWKYSQQPHIDHRIFTAAKDGEMCGYIIVRQGQAPEPDLGIIVDLFAAPHDRVVVLALLTAGVNQLRQAGCQAIVAGSSVTSFQQALLSLGFKLHKEYVPLMAVQEESPTSDEAFKAERWLLGIGDQDWNQFPNARILFG